MKNENDLFSKSNLQKLAEELPYIKFPDFKIKTIDGVANIAKILSNQHITLPNIGSQLAEQIKNSSLQTISPTLSSSSFINLNQSLKNISKISEPLSKQLAEIGKNQLILSNNLAHIAKSIDKSHLTKFNGISVALEGISNDYLKNITKTRDWNDLLVAENVSEVISSTTTDFIKNDDDGITKEDLEKLKKLIVAELSSLLEKSTSQKAIDFIFKVMIVTTFLMNLYRFNQDNGIVELETKDLLPDNIKEIEKSDIDIKKSFETIISQLNSQRIAKTDVHLRYSNKIRTNIIGIVKKGQIVSVIEIRHKYLLISYIDNVTGEPKSGFVVKKYFKKIK
ncbi:hypothetical protein [Tenacibaculum geojense]|uniref:SH3 domain-containing protein n=1 Tax=Tenacibaculum geojense TaxID=915352 RepID=A0ABW3JQV3_9FLAO